MRRDRKWIVGWPCSTTPAGRFPQTLAMHEASPRASPRIPHSPGVLLSDIAELFVCPVGRTGAATNFRKQ